jgi:hypothetical protein
MDRAVATHLPQAAGRGRLRAGRPSRVWLAAVLGLGVIAVLA